MLNRTAKNYLMQLVSTILTDHPLYSKILTRPQSPWTLDDIVSGVQATISLKGSEMDDGFNPDLDRELNAITAAQDGTLGYGGPYVMFSVVCQYVVDEIANMN